jgi:phage terminase large subunit
VETRDLPIETAPVFAALLEPARYKGAYGGRGSGKSHFFADALIERAMLEPGLRAVCIREIQKSLDDSVKQLLEDKIARFGLDREFRVLNTHIETPGDGQIIFVGMQNHTAQSIKSLEGYQIAWVEEAQTLSQFSLNLLRPTIRGEASEIWFSWNPMRKTDPVDAFMRGPSAPVAPEAILVRASYRDNPWLTDTLRNDAARDLATDPDAYAHVWLGEYERKGAAAVFRDWRPGTPDEFRKPTSGVFYYGADWGFSADPTVLLRCYLEGRTLYVDREVFAVGCEIDATGDLFDKLDAGQARKWVITADSSRPETISYLQRHGFGLMRSARKGPNSVEEGIAFLKNYTIVVHPSCTHTLDELATYSYKTDRLTGDPTPVLEDKNNHCIDALRYAVESVRRGSSAGAMHLDWV